MSKSVTEKVTLNEETKDAAQKNGEKLKRGETSDKVQYSVDCLRSPSQCAKIQTAVGFFG